MRVLTAIAGAALLASLFGCEDSAAVAGGLGLIPDVEVPEADGGAGDAGGDPSSDDGGAAPDASGPATDAAPTTVDAAAAEMDAASPADACAPSGDEICNGVDDDCDGDTDEMAEQVGDPCGSDTGECSPGVFRCRDGELSCDGGNPATIEACNGLDDDCDGVIDNDVPMLGDACGGGGGCGMGVIVCAGGSYGCEGAEGAEDEICDGEDNDCDGEVDEADPMLRMACGDDTGACELGEVRCIAGGLTCFGGVSPAPEACDGDDNDCDGATDEADDAFGDGAPCPELGGPCENNNSCTSGLCLNDNNQRYCSTVCEADQANDCGAGFDCLQRGNETVCVAQYDACTSDADCGAGDNCQLVVPRSDDILGAECRPNIPGGAELDTPCEGNRDCATGVCLGRAGLDRCGAVCQRSADCPPGFACSGQDFRLNNGGTARAGFCLRACTGDRDCGDGLACLYVEDGAQSAIIGTCDIPFEGAEVGSPCGAGVEPGTCDHGFCRRSGDDRYCTAGCETLADCPEGWNCTPQTFNVGGGQQDVGICRRPD